MTQPTATEAPGATAPEGGSPEAAPASDGVIFSDATQAYESFSFPADDAEEAAPTETAAPAPDPTTETPATATPPAGNELADADLERFEADPRFQERLERLVNNRFGNRLQQEREKAAREAIEKAEGDRAQWDEATTYYNRLSEDDDFYDAQVKEHGEAAVLRYRADYQESATARESKSAAPVDTTAIQTEYAQAFNTAAVGQFKEIVRATLPFYGDLPDETRSAIESAAYNPQANWLQPALQALGEGVQKHVDKLRRDHAAALREATEAGANDERAGREESSPVVLSGQPGADPHDIIKRYAAGDTGVSRTQFRAALKATGSEY